MAQHNQKDSASHGFRRTHMEQASATYPVTVSIKEFCARTSLSRTTAYKLAAAGQIQTVKILRRTVVVRSSVEALMAVGSE